MMPEMMSYLLKVNIALLLFYAGYHFILQRYTFHKLNRFYLLSGLVYSAVYPLIDVSALLSSNEELKQKIGGLAPDWQGSIIYIINQNGEIGIYWQLAEIFFWTGVTFLSLRFITRLISLFRLHLQSCAFTVGEFEFRKISKAVNPFSFWRTIYLNPEYHDATELRSILEHEQVHVRQLHTVDVMLAELSTIFYWFNPGVWLVKKAIKANLEFITDGEVIRSGINSKEYQYALLRSNILPQNPLPVNNFHFLTIKKRIAMINKKPSGRINLAGYVLIFPAIMLFVLATGASGANFSPENIRKAMEVLPQIQFTDIENKPASGYNIQKNDVKQKGSETLTFIPSDTIKIRNRSAKEGLTGLSEIITVLSDSISAGPERVYLMDGVRVTEAAGRIHPDSIKSIQVTKGASAISSYGAEGKGGVISITTKSSGGRLTSSASVHDSKANNANKDRKISLSLGDGKDVVYILNGKETGATELNLLNVSSISAVEVLKGAEAVTRYGERARSGVVLITTLPLRTSSQ